ncbi:MAG: Rrf2 family transcriptional regulator [bacterium]|nr:Rrf2 family transcriptional regulator [bacterium]
MYKLSSKIIYALIGLMDIILYGEEKPVPVSQIARRQKISKIYMERIFSILVKAKIVKSIKGKKGGFILLRQPSHITLYKLVKIFGRKKGEGLSFKNKSVEKSLVRLCTEIRDNLEKTFKGIKLSNIMEPQRPGIRK